MLRALVRLAPGRIDAEIQRYAAARCSELCESLISAAITAWIAENFLRFNDQEVSCTVRIYDWCRRLLRARPQQWPSMRVQYDGPKPSADMLAGLADPVAAKRPDLVISVGQVEVHVEAKRLALAKQLPRLYVIEGMMRFVGHRYAWDPGDRGMMMSYNVMDAPSATVAAVNSVVSAELSLGPAHQLHPASKPHARIERFVSEHGLPYSLIHFAIDMR